MFSRQLHQQHEWKGTRTNLKLFAHCYPNEYELKLATFYSAPNPRLGNKLLKKTGTAEKQSTTFHIMSSHALTLCDTHKKRVGLSLAAGAAEVPTQFFYSNIITVIFACVATMVGCISSFFVII